MPSTMLQKLDDRVESLRQQGLDRRVATRSSVIRTMLGQYLELDPRATREFEALESVQRAVQRAIQLELQRRLESLPAVMDAATKTTVMELLQSTMKSALQLTTEGQSIERLVAAVFTEIETPSAIHS